jgi:hypothetical protein
MIQASASEVLRAQKGLGLSDKTFAATIQMFTWNDEFVRLLIG